jgi:UDP-N-acetylmuramyl pentapeptide phosphotransferase/UDP-N-acetylglucosamine-1-phosphate transferase
MTQVEAILAGVWEFVVGDDWRTAIGVVLALALTALLADAAIAAWWVMPLAVAGLLALSIRRAARDGSRRDEPLARLTPHEHHAQLDRAER